MARRRFIHPDFFHDDHLATLPPLDRLLFIGLWCLADRDGRLEDKPIKIKMQLFPADAINVDAALDDLAVGGLVIRYQVNGCKYLAVKNFARYQHPHPREPKSTLPGVAEATPRRGRGNAKALPRQHLGVAQQGGYSGSSDTQDLQDLRSTQDPRSVHIDAIASVEDGEGDPFDVFWRLYPKKVGKGAARAAWAKLAPEMALSETIVAAVERQRRSAQWLREGGRFIPNPATFLNQQRWDDVPDPEVPAVSDKTLATLRAGAAFLKGDA